MQFVGKMISSVSEFYKDINPSTLSGAIDVIVVEDVETGELSCSPFHVRFGKLQLLRPQEKAVNLTINGVALGDGLRMKVGEAGETFFVLPRGPAAVPAEYLTSPLITGETPVPLENIEEFKLTSGGGGAPETSVRGLAGVSEASVSGLVSGVNASGLISGVSEISLVSVASAASAVSGISESAAGTEFAGQTPSPVLVDVPAIPVLPPALPDPPSPATPTPQSPEWKWEWGDLPMKKSSSSTIKEELEVGGSLLMHQPEAVEAASLGLSDYLSSREYLHDIHAKLIGFSSASMQAKAKVKVFKIASTKNLSSLEWQQLLPRILDERGEEDEEVKSEDFLETDGSVATRLFQLSWENDLVIMGREAIELLAFIQIYNRIPTLEQFTGENRRRSGPRAKESTDSIESQTQTQAHDQTQLQTQMHDQTRTAPELPAETKPIPITDNTMAPTTAAATSSWRSWWSRSSNNKGNGNGSHGASALDSTSKVSPRITVTSEAESSPTDTPMSTESRATRRSEPSQPQLQSEISLTSQSKSPQTSQTPQVSLPPYPLQVPLPPHPPHSPTPSVVSIASGSNLSFVSGFTTGTTTGSVATGAPFRATSSGFSGLYSSSGQFIKSLRLPSAWLKALNLHYGVNSISYTVNTKLQGTATCHSRVFLWRSDARVVISDIDGTITKSDALGHLFTMVGKDWTHVGVASLYSKIAKNGYEFLYLTSRAIGQAASTRGYLKGIEQDRFQLPDGPVIMSPDRLFTALHREVIQRRPDEFKISCLRDIQRLFLPNDADVDCLGSGVISSSSEDEGEVRESMRDQDFAFKKLAADSSVIVAAGPGLISAASSVLAPTACNHPPHNPFYAGFGNRPTDTKSYKAVGIPASRIFLINSLGDLKLDHLTFNTPYSTSSYVKLGEEVDKVFPPVASPQALTRGAGDEMFSDFQWWQSSAGGGSGGLGMGNEYVREALAKVLIAQTNTGATTKTSKSKKSPPLTDALVDENGKLLSPETLQLRYFGGNASASGSSEMGVTSDVFSGSSGSLGPDASNGSEPSIVASTSAVGLASLTEDSMMPIPLPSATSITITTTTTTMNIISSPSRHKLPTVKRLLRAPEKMDFSENENEDDADGEEEHGFDGGKPREADTEVKTEAKAREIAVETESESESDSEDRSVASITSFPFL